MNIKNIEFFDSQYSTYHDHRKSVEDVLRRNRTMYETDLKNTDLNSGLSWNEIEDNKSQRAIKNKLDMLKNTWNIAFDERQRLYDDATNVIKANDDNSQKTVLLVKKQTKEMSHNYNQINDIKNNLNTLRRQVEISMDESMRKNNNLYILKIILVYLLLSILPILLAKEKAISKTISIIFMVILSLIFILLILWNFYQTRNRYPLRYSVRTFNTPTVAEVLKKELVNSIEEESEQEQEEDNCDDIINELKKLFTKAKLNNELCVAGQIRKKFRDFEHQSAMGKKFCGQADNVALSLVYKEYKEKLDKAIDETAKNKTKKAKELKTKLDEINLEINQKENLINAKKNKCDNKKNELKDIKKERKDTIEELQKLGINMDDIENPNVQHNVKETGIPDRCIQDPSMCPHLEL